MKATQEAAQEVTQEASTEWLSLREAAELLRLSSATIRSWIKTRGLPAVKLSGTVVRIRRDALDHWIAEQAEGHRAIPKGKRNGAG